jgi:Rrf2 family cysteine metabolism transcriptional repressor
MLDIALHCAEGPVPLRAISKRQDITEKYLWHLINPLKSAGLIESTRGAHGGYVLAKPLSDISIKEIVRALEGPLTLVKCVEKPGSCSKAKSCVARDLWVEVAEKISQTLEAVTLKDIVESHKTKTDTAVNYNI